MHILIGARELGLDLAHDLEEKRVVLLDGTRLDQFSSKITDQDLVYLTTERYLPSLMSKLEGDSRKLQIELLKDKYLFRMLLQSEYPSFEFGLASQWSDFLSRSRSSLLIIKPRKGFFGIGVKKVTREELLSSGESILQSLGDEIKSRAGAGLGSSFSMTTSRDQSESKGSFSWLDSLLIEECIPGSEFSVDMYYDSKGSPVILNICAHPEHERGEFSNALYYSSYESFTEVYEGVNRLFSEFNRRFQAKSFPIHAEFKISAEGKIVPVEFNPLRFGGFGLSDLPYYAYGFNPIDYFFNDVRPDWNKIWESRRNLFYGWVLKYNPLSPGLDYRPDHVSFKRLFSKVLNYREIDPRAHPVSGVAYVEESSREDLLQVLRFDFNTV